MKIVGLVWNLIVINKISKSVIFISFFVDFTRSSVPSTHGEKKLLNQQISSAGIGTAVFLVIFTDFSVGFTDCL